MSGLLAVGARASGAPFTDEDFDYAQALGRQALAALEGARLHRVALEKERQDRELQIAREIQRSLFPRSRPTVEGLELAAESRPCHQVGGDYYDFIPLEGGRLGLVIADVSGKGTPASILMASVHASLRATAGTARPALLMERLNRFLVCQHPGEQVRHPVLRGARPRPRGACATSTPVTSPRTSCGPAAMLERLARRGRR